MTFKISLTGTFTGKNKIEAIKEFWSWVDDAETHDLGIVEEV